MSFLWPLLQRQVRSGIEALVGVTTDSTFGPLLVCGLGGVLVELLRDVSVVQGPASVWQSRSIKRHMRARTPNRRSGPIHAALNRLIYCLTLGVVRFVWDARKAAGNLKKHGISFEEASTAFQDEMGAYFPDTLHEDRFILIGYSRQQRLLYVVHAEVTSNAVRIISARKATRHERTRYENG